MSVFNIICEGLLDSRSSERNSSYKILLDKLKVLIPTEALEDYDRWLSPDSSEKSDVKDGIIDSIQRKEVDDFITWKLDFIKRLIESKSHLKAFQHSNILLDNFMPEGSQLTDVQLSLALFLRNKAQLSLEHYAKAIDSSSFRSAQSISQLRLQSEDRNFFIPDFLDEDNDKVFGVTQDWKSLAKVIVDPLGAKGVNANRQFIVNDLHTGLKIAQKSDIIYIEKGTYDCRKNAGKTLQITKNVSLIGSSKSEVKIIGSMVKWESCGEVYLDNLQIEVKNNFSEDEDQPIEDSIQNEDIYLLGGRTELRGCVIESSTNTAIYIMGTHADTLTELVASFSIFDGLEECRRMICPKGKRITIRVENCYASDCLSFITLIDPEEEHHDDCDYAIVDSTFSHIQDVIHLFPMKLSNYRVSLTGCIFDVSVMDEDVKSMGLHVEGASSVIVKSNKFSLYDLDSSAIYLKDIQSGVVELNICELLFESPRATSLAEGITVLDCMDELTIGNNWIKGFRIGIHLCCQDSKPNKLTVSNCEITECSIGILCKQKSVTLPQIMILEFLRLSDSNYGLMMDSCELASSNKALIQDVTYTNVPLPSLIHKNISSHVSLMRHHFEYTMDFESLDPPEADLRTKMYFYYATEKNMPYRVAYEKDQFIIIDNSDSCQNKLFS